MFNTTNNSTEEVKSKNSLIHGLLGTLVAFIAMGIALMHAILLQPDGYKVIHDIYASDSNLDTQVIVKGYYSNSLVTADGTQKEAKEDEPVYHFITAFDAPKCCSVTIEFISKDGTYPGIGDYAEVTGVYSRYSEGTNTYSTIKDASWRHLTAPK